MEKRERKVGKLAEHREPHHSARIVDLTTPGFAGRLFVFHCSLSPGGVCYSACNLIGAWCRRVC